MNKIKFTVGKTSTGYDAYYENNDRIVAITTGDNLSQLKSNAFEAYNLYADDIDAKKITADQVLFQFDVPSFFEFYGIINAKALSERIGMNNGLLSHYITGVKKPSEKQVKKIIGGLKEIGKELSELEMV